MKIAIGSDMDMHVALVIIKYLKKNGHEITLFGALKTKKNEPWPNVGIEIGESVATGKFDQGIVLCWTGTGVSIAANKVKGIRAALCNDAYTAEGARKWNNANVLAMSLRLVSEVIAKEILAAWFNTQPSEDSSDTECFRILNEKDNL